MKALICEMCNSNDLVKQDGLFVCQCCGTKYSVEEAKKMMHDGVVDVQGTVRIDTSDELAKLYQAARNARKTSDDETAIRHYENISSKDPDSWEALFYLIVLKTNSIKNSEIHSSAVNVINCLDRVFQLVSETLSDDDKKTAVQEIFDQCCATSTWLASASENFYRTMTKGNGVMAFTGLTGMISSISSTGNELAENQERYGKIANIMCVCGNSIEKYFNMESKFYQNYAVLSWKRMLEFHNEYKKAHGAMVFTNESVAEYTAKIRRYEPHYGAQQQQNNQNTVNNSGGCYVATAVYGSYDCPEVWTLRRYRDNTLAKTWYGRAFIKTYYSISPTLVKWFGNTNRFKNMWKPTLDRMVAKLNDKGVENTPYNDKQW